MGQTETLERPSQASRPMAGVIELPAALTWIFAELERAEEEREKAVQQRQEQAPQPRRVPRPFAYD